LVSRAQHGEAGARAAVLEAIVPRLRRRLLRILRVPADVEDALQDTLLAVSHSLESFRHESSIMTFALKIAERRGRAHRRRRGLREIIHTEVTRLEEPLFEPSPVPHDEAVANARRSQLSPLLEALPRAQSEALALRAAGFSLPEIAERSGVPLNTVRTRLRLAQRALRRLIDGDHALAELLGR
jgi:RNA polymerase sigma-70 factor, ECF subfamily